MVAGMDYLTSRDVGVLGPIPLYSQNLESKMMVTENLLRMLQKIDAFHKLFLGISFNFDIEI